MQTAQVVGASPANRPTTLSGCSTTGSGRSHRQTSVCVNRGVLGRVQGPEAPCWIRRSKHRGALHGHESEGSTVRLTIE